MQDENVVVVEDDNLGDDDGDEDDYELEGEEGEDYEDEVRSSFLNLKSFCY